MKEPKEDENKSFLEKTKKKAKAIGNGIKKYKEPIVTGIVLIGGMAIAYLLDSPTDAKEKINNSSNEDSAEGSNLRCIIPGNEKREYKWDEDGHNVRPHKRHYKDGKIVPIPGYYKPTGTRETTNQEAI